MASLAESFFVTASDTLFGWLKNHLKGWQYGEQGLLTAIFDKLGQPDVESGFTEGNSFAEVGAGNGDDKLPLTCQPFIDAGWHGRLFEGDPASVEGLKKRHAAAIEKGQIEVFEGYVTTLQNAPHLRLYVIDVDGADWYLFASLLANKRARPEVVMVEHMDVASELGRKPYLPSLFVAGQNSCPENPAKGYIIQASSHILEMMAHGAYVLVCATRVNSIFVRGDLVEKLRA